MGIDHHRMIARGYHHHSNGSWIKQQITIRPATGGIGWEALVNGDVLRNSENLTRIFDAPKEAADAAENV